MLVGGGHAHVQVLRRWAMRPPDGARLMVVLDQPVAVYSGMVPGLVAGDYEQHQLEIDVVPLARRAGAGVILAAATDLDPVRREIALEGRPPIHYDLASIDVGSTVRGLDLPGVREFALSTRPIARFVRSLGEHIERLRTLDRPPRLAIVGAGAAGCEIALTLDARLRGLGLEPEISVVTSDDAILAGAAPAARRALVREANARGLATHLCVRVERVERDAVVMTAADEAGGTGAVESRLAADLVIWATGAAPVAFPANAGLAGLPKDARGSIEVRDTLEVVGFEGVFAAGDCARLVDHPWVPRAGVYAVREGPFLDTNLRARLEGRSLRRYTPQRDFLALLNVGGGRALGSKWGRAFRGELVFRLKDWIDRRFMERFQVLGPDGTPNPALVSLGNMSTGSDDDEPNVMPCGGCAAKLGAEPLAAALAGLPSPPDDPSVVLGVESRDDVAATRAPDGGTTLHNIDAIRAFCDDPWLVGRVAAVNALSDLHAKGGTPRHAQAIVTLPEWPPEVAEKRLRQLLLGVRSILDAQGVSLLGGHTTLGDELMVGLSVTGDGPTAHEILHQAGARVGDVLVLTQPIGTGVVLAADMQGLARGAWVGAAHEVMQHANDRAGRIAIETGAHASTDVTGFGLAGHLLTLLAEGDLVAELEPGAVPLLPGARFLFRAGHRSTAHPANQSAFAPRIVGASEEDEAWLFDPQTAGGLLLALDPKAVDGFERAMQEAGEGPVSRIGRITRTDAPGGAIRLGIS